MTRIHVNMQTINRNRNYGRRDPILSVVDGDSVQMGHSVAIDGPSRVIYDPEGWHMPDQTRPVTVWIETSSPVTVERDQ